MAKTGPKSKLTNQLIDEIATYIENGLSNKDAADLCGVRDTTLYRWLREAEELDEKGKPKNKQQCKLKEAIIKAQAAFKAYHVQSITRASRKAWQASAWLLERKFPDEYAAIDRNSIIAAIKAASQVHEDDGLVAALNASVDDSIITGDVPDDI